MKKITVRELVANGYQEDPSGAEELERRWNAPLMLVLAFGLAGAAYCFFGKVELVVIPLVIVATLVAGALVFLVAYLSPVRSKKTGRPMEKYVNAEPEGDTRTEIIYVCPESRTFFRKVWTREGPSVPDV